MPIIKLDKANIYYEFMGEDNTKTIVLISGLASQMVRWELPFCKMLVEKGFCVLRFDNRDCGQSEYMNKDDINAAHDLTSFLENPSLESVPYSLWDLANDLYQVLIKLELRNVSLIGRSMGGVIGQLIAYSHPEIVKSLTIIMSTSLRPGLPEANTDVLALMTKKQTDFRENKSAFIQEKLYFANKIHGTKYKLDKNIETALIELELSRIKIHNSPSRQVIAMITYRFEEKVLNNIKVPTLIIHGTEDPVFHPECANDLAKSIPGSKLIMVEGMGHAMPHEFFNEVICYINEFQKEISV